MQDIPNLIAQMTLEEKASLCSGADFWHLKGIERLGIPSIMVTDGPHGLRKQLEGVEQVELDASVPATCFPTASALAATWNRELVFQVGEALGEACLEEKVGVILGPGANIKRSPLCGRNFEYFSEDPYLSGEIAKSHIQGVQSKGVGTSLKHFAANNQETRRMVIDAVVDERALREIYLAGFEIAVKEARPWTVMCAYNKLNGAYCDEHQTLLTDILRGEWGFDGLVVTDWGAMSERVPALAAGTDLEMPGVPNGNDAMIAAAVREGRLDEGILDRAVARILKLIARAAENLDGEQRYDRQAQHALARKAAGEGAVLLKNEGGVLPLETGTRVALIGEFAKKPRYQGSGSSQMNPTRLDNLYDEIVILTGAKSLSYAPGYTPKGDQADETLIEDALRAAGEADVVVICAGLTDMYEVEGLDRAQMKLPPGHDALIERIAAAHPRVVVVLSNGSPVEMPWADEVPAILEGYLGGQAGAGAIADILFGVVNPSGKLAETFPLKLADNPSYPYFPGGPGTVEYRESLYVGYRYYDSVGQAVRYPFGHGLSYTTFEYSDLRLSQDAIQDTDSLTVSFKIKNTGERAGKEAAQVYVRDVESTAFRPDKELKGFAKVDLQPGESRQVVIELDRRAFATYHTGLKDWYVEPGSFEILVGASSGDIRLQASVEVLSTRPAWARPDRDALAPYYNFSQGVPVSQAAFEAILGRPVPANQAVRKGAYTIHTAMDDMGDSTAGRLFNAFSRRQINKIIQGEADSPVALLMAATAREAPLRFVLMSGSESLNREMLEAMLLMFNGKLWRGLRAMLKAAQASKT